MLDTTSNPGTYQRLFRVKALHLEFLLPEDQLYLVDHYVTYCQTALRYQQTEAQDFANDPLKQEHISGTFRVRVLDLIKLTAHQWQLELTWAQRLREQVVSAQTGKDRQT